MKTILVADGEPRVRSEIAGYLSSAGHLVREVSDGREVVAAIGHGVVDLVITDVYMPGMEGTEGVRRRSQDEEAPIVIIMSGKGEVNKQTVLEMASRLGAARTLEKPFSREQLLVAIEAELTR